VFLGCLWAHFSFEPLSGGKGGAASTGIMSSASSSDGLMGPCLRRPVLQDPGVLLKLFAF